MNTEYVYVIYYANVVIFYFAQISQNSMKLNEALNHTYANEESGELPSSNTEMIDREMKIIYAKICI